MPWLIKMFSSSLGKKLLIALTGFFLVTFLIVHLAGNLQLLNNDEGRSFNQYAHFMGTNPIIQAISKINLLIICTHMIWATLLAKSNKNARGPTGYTKISTKSTAWSSRHMLVLGIIIFTFLVIHLYHFWAKTHFGNMVTVGYDGKDVPNLYATVVYWFSKSWYVALYVLGMFGVAFHLWHGLPSVFQTFGINHMKYNAGILFIGRSMAVILAGMFAYIPIVMHVRLALP